MHRRLKRITALVCAAMLLVGSSAFAYDDAALTAAKTLFDIGLMKGNESTFSAESMDLDSFATRGQIAVTVTRMLGKDAKAQYQWNAHPFSDVPLWASPYVGWLYENYLVNGASATYYGAEDAATLQQFSAMMLRVLGYTETEGDFAYADAVSFAVQVGLAEANMTHRYELVRSDMMKMCRNALSLPIKNSKRRLAEKLCDEKAISKQSLALLNITKTDALTDYFAHVEGSLPRISATAKGNSVVIRLDSPVEHYGVRVFYVAANGNAVCEAKLNGGSTYYNKGEIMYLNGGAAGYIDTLYVYQLPREAGTKIMVVKTSSEGEMYTVSAKSNIVTLD